MTGDELQQIRKQMNRTQQHMADSLGIGRSYYAELERGKRHIEPRLERQALIVFLVHQLGVLTGLVDGDAAVTIAWVRSRLAIR